MRQVKIQQTVRVDLVLKFVVECAVLYVLRSAAGAGSGGGGTSRYPVRVFLRNGRTRKRAEFVQVRHAIRGYLSRIQILVNITGAVESTRISYIFVTGYLLRSFAACKSYVPLLKAAH